VRDLRYRQSDRVLGEQEAVAVVGEFDRFAGEQPIRRGVRVEATTILLSRTTIRNDR
jgi:hypothetical protein